MDKVQLMEHLKQASHEELCSIWRFASNTSPYMREPDLFEVLRHRLFDLYGGFTPDISKLIGWEGPSRET